MIPHSLDINPDRMAPIPIHVPIVYGLSISRRTTTMTMMIRPDPSCILSSDMRERKIPIQPNHTQSKPTTTSSNSYSWPVYQRNNTHRSRAEGNWNSCPQLSLAQLRGGVFVCAYPRRRAHGIGCWWWRRRYDGYHTDSTSYNIERL